MEYMIKNKRKKALNPRRKKDLIFATVMLALPILQYLIFYVGVNFNSVLMAFQNMDMIGNASWAGFGNFKTVLTDLFSESFSSMWSSSFTAYLVGLIVGVPLALLFSFYIAKKRTFHGVFSVFLFLPAVLPTLSLTMMFGNVVNASIPSFMADMGIVMRGLMNNDDTVFGTLLFYSVWASFGGNVLLYVGAMRGISESVVEAAELDGATGFKEFYYITLPLVYGTIVTFIVAGIAGIFTNQLFIVNFYGVGGNVPSKVTTFGYYLYAGVALEEGSLSKYPYFAAMGLCFTVVVAPTVFIVKFLMEKYGPSAE